MKRMGLKVSLGTHILGNPDPPIEGSWPIYIYIYIGGLSYPIYTGDPDPYIGVS